LGEGISAITMLGERVILDVTRDAEIENRNNLSAYPHYIIDVARQLRKRSTIPEKILWERLRRHQLGGFKFKRQHHIGRYVVDFFCSELRLIVELEGGIHEKENQKEYDEVRFEELESLGFKTLRIKNDEVINNIENVIKKILKFRYRPSPLSLRDIPSPDSSILFRINSGEGNSLC
jgi:very-short-patch-repair endonuclease